MARDFLPLDEGSQGVSARLSTVRLLIAPALAVIVYATASGPALADYPSGGSTTGGAVDGQTIVSQVQFEQSSNHDRGKSGGELARIGAWKPPACWAEPFLGPEALAEWAQREWWGSGSVGHEWTLRQRDYYVNGKPHKDFNAGKAGMWWGHVGNYGQAKGAAVAACMARHSHFLWVPQGSPVPAEANLSAETLAGLAYGRLRVPDTTASVSPQARQTVNLPTWVWLDNAVFKAYSVTASLPAVGLSATTTARPVGLRIVPGTPHAKLFPQGGRCVFSNGKAGVPYTKGAKGDPPCGLMYRRASTAGPYKFAVTVTWRVSWTGSDGTGDELGDDVPVSGPVQNMTVQEIQAIVTRGE